MLRILNCLLLDSSPAHPLDKINDHCCIAWWKVTNISGKRNFGEFVLPSLKIPTMEEELADTDDRTLCWNFWDFSITCFDNNFPYLISSAYVCSRRVLWCSSILILQTSTFSVILMSNRTLWETSDGRWSVWFSKSFPNSRRKYIIFQNMSDLSSKIWTQSQAWFFATFFLACFKFYFFIPSFFTHLSPLYWFCCF